MKKEDAKTARVDAKTRVCLYCEKPNEDMVAGDE